MSELPSIPKPKLSDKELIGFIWGGAVVGVGDMSVQLITKNVDYYASTNQPDSAPDLHFNEAELGGAMGVGALLGVGLVMAVRFAAYKRKVERRKIEIEEAVAAFKISMGETLGTKEGQEPKIQQ